MTQWRAKRFWSEVSLEEVAKGFSVLLDGKPVQTPAKSKLVVPTQSLADHIAAEWDAQEETIYPGSMPYTRMTNSAIDKVTLQFSEVVDHLAAYAETDHLCYRAEGPNVLVKRQADAWDPLLAWAAKMFNAPLTVATGVMFVTQPSNSLERLKERITRLSPFQLAAVHDLISISGSLVASLAVIHRKKAADEVWKLCRVDEIWQIEHWGEDKQEQAISERKMVDFLHAAHYFDTLRLL
ncbi:MAG: ATPase [Rhodobacteraceae bacterium]|nr:ATPase [Paracoccaceae bacterium]